MGRLIDADALKASLGMKNDCSECGEEWKACHYDRIYSKMDFCEWIDDAPTVYPEQPKMGKWILVSEDIPPAYTEVLLQFDHNMAVGFWNDGEWATNTGDGIYTPIFESEGKPIAWRWLPEWYVEGKDGND